MNQWIYLAQAATGHANGKRYEKALKALRATAGRVVIPLASAHYMEVDGIRDAERRLNFGEAHGGVERLRVRHATRSS